MRSIVSSFVLLLAALPMAAQSAPAKPTAVFHTTAGDLTCELFPDKAPKTVANFVGLAEGTREWTDPKTNQKVTRPFYDGLVFHRVIDGFMIQGGCPMGNGMGGPGYKFADEFGPGLRHDRAGLIRSVLEGVAYSLRDCLELFREVGVPVRDVRASGGGARSLLWRQIQADVLRLRRDGSGLPKSRECLGVLSER